MSKQFTVLFKLLLSLKYLSYIIELVGNYTNLANTKNLLIYPNGC